MKSAEIISEIGKSKEYPNPIGIMEFYKFNQIASVEQKNFMKRLIGMKKYGEAIKLLQDVTGTKLREAEIRTPASTEIRTAMRKYGYKILGSGQDATVWAKKSGPVIKIIMPSDGEGAGVAGDTFMKFYEFCLENPGLENLPKFSTGDANVFQADGKDYIMVNMERLSPIPNGSIQEALVWILSDHATKDTPWQSLLKIIKQPGTWTDYGGGLSPDAIVNTVNSYSRKELLEWQVIYRLMTLLYLRGRINKVDWDLHTENAMLRGSTVVITDPWFGHAVDQ